MLRSQVVVHSAGVDEVALLAPLWADFQTQNSASIAVPGSVDIGERVRERIALSDAAVAAGSCPTYRLVVASLDGVPVGFTSLTVVDRGLMSTSSAVLVDVVHVSEGHRKSGVGTALLREAAGFADEVGASDVVVNVPPHHRDVNRFYARHGFAPMVVRRAAPIGALRRKLGVDPRMDPRDATVDLTPVQRTLRRRALLTPRRAARP